MSALVSENYGLKLGLFFCEARFFFLRVSNAAAARTAPGVSLCMHVARGVGARDVPAPMALA